MSTIRVDRITPYQSGSVAIEGLNITNLTIDGTLTASLQQGYVWVGNSSGRTTTVATSSFGGGGGSDITALNSFTASADGRLDNLELTTSSLQTEVNAIKSFTQSADVILFNLETFTSSQENLNVTFATTGSNTFVGNQIVTGSLDVVEGEFSVLTGSGQLTSSLTFTHNITAPNDGNAILELRHNNDLYNDDVAIKLKADFAGAYIDYEEDGTPYPVLSVQSFANKNIYIHRDTRLLFSSLRIDNNLILTGSLLSSASAYFLGDVTASSFTGSFVGDGSGLTSVPSTLDTSSFATTGSNTFIENQTISGSLSVSGSVNVDGSGYIILLQLSASQEYADDFAAAAGGVPLGGLYRNGGLVRIRIT